jgi:hypothetical protein
MALKYLNLHNLFNLKRLHDFGSVVGKTEFKSDFLKKPRKIFAQVAGHCRPTSKRNSFT